MPNPHKYRDFDLEILPRNGKYVARVLASPGGTGSAEFALPFTDQDIEILLLKMGFTSARKRGRDASKLAAAREFGGKLFTTVFTGQVGQCWLNSVQQVTMQDEGLRLRLRLKESPELADLPWEFLFDGTFDQFLNHSVETPLVRFLELPSPPRAVTIQPPLRILVVISLPSDWEELAADREWENMQRELQDLVGRGVIALERTDQATLPALQKKLRQGKYNILHFVGHGEYVPALQENVLLLENAQGQSKQVDGSTLGTLLLGHRSLRLVVLNACEGARASRSDPFGGVAQKLIQTGIPAVVAMQFAISDTAALKLSSEFYSALADNYPIDAALAEARRAIFFDDNAVEWATPVLYLQAPDGIIFDVQGAPQPAVVEPAKEKQEPSAPPRQSLGRTDTQPPTQPPGTDDFNPVGRWNIQVQDMVGSRLFVEFTSNGSFQMMQQVGMYQVPVNGSWGYNPLTRQLSLQGVVNTFQPFVLVITINGALPNGYSAVGNDGIGYVLTRE